MEIPVRSQLRSAYRLQNHLKFGLCKKALTKKLILHSRREFRNLIGHTDQFGHSAKGLLSQMAQIGDEIQMNKNVTTRILILPYVAFIYYRTGLDVFYTTKARLANILYPTELTASRVIKFPANKKFAFIINKIFCLLEQILFSLG